MAERVSESDFEVTRRLLRQSAELLEECQAENDRLRAEIKRLKKPTWRERLVAWIDPGPESDEAGV